MKNCILKRIFFCKTSMYSVDIVEIFLQYCLLDESPGSFEFQYTVCVKECFTRICLSYGEFFLIIVNKSIKNLIINYMLQVKKSF